MSPTAQVLVLAAVPASQLMTTRLGAPTARRSAAGPDVAAARQALDPAPARGAG